MCWWRSGWFLGADQITGIDMLNVSAASGGRQRLPDAHPRGSGRGVPAHIVVTLLVENVFHHVVRGKFSIGYQSPWSKSAACGPFPQEINTQIRDRTLVFFPAPLKFSTLRARCTAFETILANRSVPIRVFLLRSLRLCGKKEATTRSPRFPQVFTLRAQ
jgi:hypothetical protein